MNDVLGKVLEARSKHGDNKALITWGEQMFKLHTEDGYPPDMCLDELSKRLSLDESQKIFVVSEYQKHFIEHRRKAGIEEKNLDKARKRNIENMDRLIRTGELGIY